AVLPTPRLRQAVRLESSGMSLISPCKVAWGRSWRDQWRGNNDRPRASSGLCPTTTTSPPHPTTTATAAIQRSWCGRIGLVDGIMLVDWGGTNTDTRGP